MPGFFWWAHDKSDDENCKERVYPCKVLQYDAIHKWDTAQVSKSAADGNEGWARQCIGGHC